MANTTIAFISCYASEILLNSSQGAKVFYACLCAICVLGTLITCLGNGLFVLAMLRQARRLTMPQKLLLMLAGTDLLQGLTIWPVATSYHFYQMDGQLKCVLTKVTGTMGYDLVLMTVFAILTISVEQFIAIAYPFAHQRLITTRRAIAFFALLTIIHALANYLVSFPLYSKSSWLTYKVTIGIAFVSVTLIVSSFQIRVMFIASAKARAVSYPCSKEKRVLMYKAKAAKATLLILIAFVLAYIPYTVYAAYIFALKKGSLVTRTYVQPSVEVIALWNSALNPVVYYWRLHYARAATKALLRMQKQRVSSGEYSSRRPTSVKLSFKSSPGQSTSFMNGTRIPA